MQLGSPNVTYECSTMLPGNPFILGSKDEKVKVTSQPAWVVSGRFSCSSVLNDETVTLCSWESYCTSGIALSVHYTVDTRTRLLARGLRK